MPQVTAIIPTLSNTIGLKHLIAELTHAHIPYIVVDNTKQTKNLYFAAAVNLGAEQAATEWLLIANDDIEGLTAEKVNLLVESALRNKWDAVSPLLMSPSGMVENIGYTVLPIGRVALNFDSNKYSDADLDGLTAASLLIKKAVFDAMKGFDESFIAYLEDVDLFLRLKKANYHFGVNTQVTIVHQHLTTSKTMKGFKERQDFINWWKIVTHHFDRKMWLYHGTGIIIERLKNLSGWLKAILR